MVQDLETGRAVDDAALLPVLPDVVLGLVRHSRTAGDPLIDAVEAVLRGVV
ncbi:hypothetical protein ABH926_005800 [Catenulispora sp. GP43]|uniref:hypothetical protein n=1 Tax=Catenulispora sp. GP43 TaxID=3156263 RepID=UPI0035181142